METWMKRANRARPAGRGALEWALLATALSAGGAMAIAPAHAFAQPPSASDAGTPHSDAAAPSDEDEVEEEEGWDEEEPQLRAPTLDMGNTAPAEEEEEDLDEDEEADDDEEAEEEEEEDEDDELPNPDRVAERLDGAGSDPTVAPWVTPQTVFELHGYMRMRGEFQDDFFLGRVMPGMLQAQDLPFSRFIPVEDGVAIDGLCPNTCDQNALAFANMRFRLEPTIHLSDDVRIHAQIDVFDNLVLGSTPEGLSTQQPGWVTGQPNPYVPLIATSQSQQPPQYGQNSLTDSIRARRAWAEVRNRGLGEIRFGRMGNHWGLGILANDGRGIDQDYQSDVDRIMAITRILGFYVFGAWDFASEGFLYQNPQDTSRYSFDRSRLDDVEQVVVGVARRSTPEEQAEALQRGDFVLNGGIFFVYRTQNVSLEGISNQLTSGLGGPSGTPASYVRRGFEVFVPDLWVQFLWGDLRLEAEGVVAVGSIANSNPGLYDPSSRLNILQGAFAFEGEYHMLNRQLGIYFNAGYASGDADVEGLSIENGGVQQPGPNGVDHTSSTFYMHPAYRIDLIFWRTIMRQIGGAYYFRPGLSYDFIRNSFGQLLGARADVIYSRASEVVQTYGNSADLGLEIDAQVYYRSEDGPDLLDGFYVSVQYGIFFPFQGLGYLPGTFAPGVTPTGGQNAQTLRLVLGVQY